MKSLKKVAIVLVICLIAISLVCENSSFAYDMMGDIKNQAGGTASGNVVSSVQTISGSIITIARVICAAVAVSMLAILGMKYMTAAPSEKADIKKHAVVYIVGAVVMFACTGILGIIQNFATVLEK